jgi:hypothetical protein
MVIALAAALAAGGYAAACGTSYTNQAATSGDGGGAGADGSSTQAVDAGGGGGDAQAPADGAACMPPACGGAGGRCGKVDACGLTFSCGDCAPPYSCVAGTCQCEGDASCGARSAACGTFDDGCGTKFTCGTCDAGPAYCQEQGAGYICGSAPCVPNPKETTCSGKCMTVTDNCGQSVDCGTTCNSTSPPELCVAASQGAGASCSCPARQLPLDEFLLNAKHCYDAAMVSTECNGQGAQIAKMYSAAYPGLVPLYRCTHNPQNHTYLETTSATCEGSTEFMEAVQIGYCAPANATTCGAVPLYRYAANSAGGTGSDRVLTLAATAPFGFAQASQVVVCNVWTN